MTVYYVVKPGGAKKDVTEAKVAFCEAVLGVKLKVILGKFGRPFGDLDKLMEGDILINVNNIPHGVACVLTARGVRIFRVTFSGENGALYITDKTSVTEMIEKKTRLVETVFAAGEVFDNIRSQ